MDAKEYDFKARAECLKQFGYLPGTIGAITNLFKPTQGMIYEYYYKVAPRLNVNGQKELGKLRTEADVLAMELERLRYISADLMHKIDRYLLNEEPIQRDDQELAAFKSDTAQLRKRVLELNARIKAFVNSLNA